VARRKLYFADLTHTSQGISAATFPLGISFVAAYAQQELDDSYDPTIFKFPDRLEAAITSEPPSILCLSNYSWNFELAYTVARLTKASHPETITVFGGPNFPIIESEQRDFLSRHPAIDFYISLEGELGFVDLVNRLEGYDLDPIGLMEDGARCLNTSYLYENQFVTGPVERIVDLNQIPSPYLSGALDRFFDLPLAPMFETTRGCPFSCSFCADGIVAKSRVRRFSDGRIREELEYIAERITLSDELIITDLNFGMYKQDLETSEAIAQLQADHSWPVLVKASAGKNKPERVIEAASILKGSWMIGSAIQSSDPDVLKAINRGNISSEAFTRFIEYSNGLSKDALTYTEIILGLPGDTKEKHFESLNYGVHNQVNSLRMYQAVMLMGTEMATPESRNTFELQTRFRTIPGCVGIYSFFGEEHPVAEIEEIIVGGKTMSFDDYGDCRLMNLIIETFYNNALFEEVFAMLRTMGVPVFDVLCYLHGHEELYSPKVSEIFDSFRDQTMNDLFASYEDAKNIVLTDEIIERYVDGELGINELLVHKGLLYSELGDIAGLLILSVKEVLARRGQLTEAVELYLSQLRDLIVCRKSNILDSEDVVSGPYTFDFEAIQQLEGYIDPNHYPACEPINYIFVHSVDQKSHIAKQSLLYCNSPIGLGRFIQRSNLKNMYRTFSRLESVESSVS